MGDESDAMWEGDLIEEGRLDADIGLLKKSLATQRMVLAQSRDPKQRARVSKRIRQMEAELDALES